MILVAGLFLQGILSKGCEHKGCKESEISFGVGATENISLFLQPLSFVSRGHRLILDTGGISASRLDWEGEAVITHPSSTMRC